MRLFALLTLLASLTGCTGAPSLPQPNGPMIVWNTGMWNTTSNATMPAAQSQSAVSTKSSAGAH